jgi:ribosomal protein S19
VLPDFEKNIDTLTNDSASLTEKYYRQKNHLLRDLKSYKNAKNQTEIKSMIEQIEVLQTMVSNIFSIIRKRIIFIFHAN